MCGHWGFKTLPSPRAASLPVRLTVATCDCAVTLQTHGANRHALAELRFSSVISEYIYLMPPQSPMLWTCLQEEDFWPVFFRPSQMHVAHLLILPLRLPCFAEASSTLLCCSSGKRLLHHLKCWLNNCMKLQAYEKTCLLFFFFYKIGEI